MTHPTIPHGTIHLDKVDFEGTSISASGKAVFEVSSDGIVSFGKHLVPDEAAALAWNALLWIVEAHNNTVMLKRPNIPHGTMTVAKARKKWDALYKAAQDGTDPARTFDAVQDFAGIAETMFIEWSKT